MEQVGFVYIFGVPRKGFFKYFSMKAQSIINNPVVKYFREAKVELEKVSWPTKKETIKYSSLVLGLSLAVAILTGIFDLGLTKGLEYLISIIPA